MREIKFRAWRKKKKAMVQPGLEIKNIGLGEGSVLIDERTQDGDELVWMQFTGLLDKNGKEIYEGDILLIGDDSLDQDYDEEKDEFKDKEKVKVVWCGEHGYPAFDIEPNPFDEVNGLSQIDGTGRMEVIGNIYENPELLK